ncbi:TetR/AcrR family transcriptional regulator [Gordonia shandongensis]|uniref:TetR/AcrR family transcriptional regulator n=1 Tax=Gordonia shandongensis TaxID=376351 RepID=UPI00146ED178|nr:TetR/AcrR family transcriptional regulator [Gordonia shandongensis]
MPTPPGSDRRELIAEAGIRIIAREGVRALTHRSVDRTAGIPPGSTSYHARTREALLTLIVDTLSARTVDETASTAALIDQIVDDTGEIGTVDLARILASLIDSLTARADDMRARYSLILELDGHPGLKQALTTGSTVNTAARRVIAPALTQAGIDATDAAIDSVITLTESLIFHRVAIDPASPVQPILAAFLTGLGRTGPVRVRAPSTEAVATARDRRR